MASGDAAPKWGPVQASALTSANDLGGAQSWNTSRELMTDTVRLQATRHERIRIDGASELVIDHAYGAAVSAARAAASIASARVMAWPPIGQAW